jgi:hypothetical protein
MVVFNEPTEARGSLNPMTHASRAARDDDQPVARFLACAEDLLAVSSLERAVSGEASVADVGALAWMLLRDLAPCDAMAIFVYDGTRDELTAGYAAGLHAKSLRHHRVSGPHHPGMRSPANPAGPDTDPDAAATLDPPLLCAFAVPLVYDECLVGVLALYAVEPDAFDLEHERLVELMAPSLAVSVASVVEVPPPVPLAPPKRPSHLRLVHSR